MQLWSMWPELLLLLCCIMVVLYHDINEFYYYYDRIEQITLHLLRFSSFCNFSFNDIDILIALLAELSHVLKLKLLNL